MSLAERHNDKIEDLRKGIAGALEGVPAAQRDSKLVANKATDIQALIDVIDELKAGPPKPEA
jgi:hypothetical protein